MNVLWVAALALIVFIEKAVPTGPLAGRVLACGLVAWGLGVMAIS